MHECGEIAERLISQGYRRGVAVDEIRDIGQIRIRNAESSCHFFFVVVACHSIELT